MKRCVTAIIAMLMVLAIIPAATAASSDYTLVIPGGEIADSMEELDGVYALRTDIRLDGVTDDKLLTALSFNLTFDPEQIEYTTNSQELGKPHLVAVDENGHVLSPRYLIINDREAAEGRLRFVFASDYGCRVEEGEPIISLYFFLNGPVHKDTKIEFSIDPTIDAESVAMIEQDGSGRYQKRTVGLDLHPYTANEGVPGIEVNIELVFDPRDVAFKGKTPYVIYGSGNMTPRVTVRNTDTGETVDPEFYELRYDNNTKAGTATVTADLCHGYYGEATAWYKIYLPETTKTTVRNIESGVLIEWEPVEGAKGYVIYRRAWNLVSSGWTTFERWFNTTETSWVDGSDENHKVYAGTRYQYGVKAYPEDPMNNYDLGFVGPLATTVRITTRKLVSLTPGFRTITVKWSPSKVFTGYQIQCAHDEAFTERLTEITVDDPAVSEWTIKGLSKAKVFYVRVRSYHEFEGRTYYGGWSDVMSCKVK